MSQQHHDVLAANWDPEILAAYVAKVQNGDDSDDAMSSGDDSDSEVEFEEEPSTMIGIEIPRPDDIDSDDSAFSSEDEFAEKEIIETQTMRRELVLGRPTAAIMQMHARDLQSMHLAYMKQLDDADQELAELTGAPYCALVRREPVSGLDDPVVQGEDLEEYILELRKRSNKEISSTESRTVRIQELAVLAQALFRKERQIKHLQG
ncbi:hypothetical protein GGX14DRAFT_693571 [Mycena pura]|uniref:Uncharacterized protein n=1 Tax=Mycena pura TaxID=153505 RepID=A0AAD6YPH7_9AGAR|nr:hypothetical protein GGX14DRAFT_693571 [Mycena pura]